MSNALKLD